MKLFIKNLYIHKYKLIINNPYLLLSNSKIEFFYVLEHCLYEYKANGVNILAIYFLYLLTYKITVGDYLTLKKDCSTDNFSVLSK